MLSIDALRELYDYNYWARDRQLEACARLGEEQFLRPMGNSYSSLRDTLAHLLLVEWIWHERFRGRSPRTLPGMPEGLTLDEATQRWNEQLPSVESVRKRWLAVERDVRDFVSSVKPDDLARPLTYVNIKGETWTYALGEVLLHLVNHQTYHRGQVTTLLRQLGSAAPAIDFLVYLDGKR